MTKAKMINYPTFTWDWYQIGGGYKAELKLKVGEEDDENLEYYRWKILEFSRNGRLFWSSLLSTLKNYITPRFVF